jgi:hypothetical protein
MGEGGAEQAVATGYEGRYEWFPVSKNSTRPTPSAAKTHVLILAWL